MLIHAAISPHLEWLHRRALSTTVVLPVSSRMSCFAKYRTLGVWPGGLNPTMASDSQPQSHCMSLRHRVANWKHRIAKQGGPQSVLHASLVEVEPQ